MNALIFLVGTLLSLALGAVILRLLLQITRADFRNPVAQALVQVTNPLILPLRRILPPVGKVDTASVVAVLLVAVVHVAILSALSGQSLAPPHLWLRAVVSVILRVTLNVYLYSLFFYSLLSFIAQGGGYSPVQSLLDSLCEPVLRPIRRVIPPFGPLDLSPLWAMIAIIALLMLIP